MRQLLRSDHTMNTSRMTRATPTIHTATMPTVSPADQDELSCFPLFISFVLLLVPELFVSGLLLLPGFVPWDGPAVEQLTITADKMVH